MTDPVYDVIHGIVKAVGNPNEPQGGTVTLTSLPLPTVGYWVGGVASSLVYPSFVVLDGPEIGRWMSRRQSRYVGWWKDGNRIHLDWVSWYASRSAAIAIGKQRGEAAIFDIEGQDEIHL